MIDLRHYQRDAVARINAAPERRIQSMQRAASA
jgi:hypothetical protein